MSKKMQAILILAIMFVNGAGFYIYYAAQLWQIQKEMRATLNGKQDNQLVVLQLSYADYQKSKVEEHEINVVGKMYDVAKAVSQGDSIIVYCLHDHDEDILLAILKEVVDPSSHDKSDLFHSITQLISITYISPGTYTYHPLLSAISCKTMTLYIFSIITFQSLPETPPPLLA